MNDEKVWDLPRAVSATAKLNSIVFFVRGGCTNCEYYLGNLRVATGAPDTRNKILTEGKWVTHGILFDVNSDKIKAQSYGSLKEIAGVLTEHADLKVQIVGHTDSDGDDAANMDLSKRRAASVKAALTTEFKIDRLAWRPMARARASRSTRTTTRQARPTTAASSSSIAESEI